MKPLGWAALAGAGVFGWLWLKKRHDEEQRVLVSAKEMIEDANGQAEIDVTADVRAPGRRAQLRGCIQDCNKRFPTRPRRLKNCRRLCRGQYGRRRGVSKQGGTVDVEDFELMQPTEDVPSDTAHEPDLVAIDPYLIEAQSALAKIRSRTGMTRTEIALQELKCRESYGMTCAQQWALGLRQAHNQRLYA